MMYGMHGIALAMMVLGAIAALAVITLTVLAAVWLARDIGGSEVHAIAVERIEVAVQDGGRQRVVEMR